MKLVTSWWMAEVEILIDLKAPQIQALHSFHGVLDRWIN